MGTTLTGTTPQDTYDSLIKVTDNAPLTGSLKVLTDGLGNDSSLSLSTTAASLSGTLAVSGNAAFDTNTLFVDATNNRVGIGTASPADGVLNLASATQFGTTICHTFLTVGAAATKVTSNGAYAIGVDAADGSTERMRITSAGNVGIGTSAPAVKLDVVGDIRTSTGILFGSDTAAANALDDYEEGTWTPAIRAATTDPIGLTYSFIGGKYTKIGRVVNVNFGMFISNVGAGGLGAVFISGLPFTAMATGAYQDPSSRIFGGDFVTASYASSVYGFVAENTTQILFRVGQNVDAQVPFTEIKNGTFLSASFTYFV